MTYVPTLADMQYLAMTDPVMGPIAGNVRDLSRSRAFVRGEDISDQVGALYSGENGYLDLGGAPLTESPIPGVAGDEEIVDQTYAEACPDCAPNSPCCMDKLELGCEHNGGRAVLPNENHPPLPNKIALIADKGDESNRHDTLKGKLVFTSNPNCKQNSMAPKLHISGDSIDKQVSAEFEEKLYFSPETAYAANLTNIQKFGQLTYDYLFGDVEDSANKIGLSVISCGGMTDFNTEVLLYPEVSWNIPKLTFDMTTKFYTNGMFVFEPQFSGEVIGTYDGNDMGFKVDLPIVKREDHILHAGAEQNMGPVPVPFFDKLYDAMTALSTDASNVPSAGNKTLSYFSISHVANLASCKFNLVEHPGNPGIVGIDSEITIGFAPLFGMEVYLDVIDVVASRAGPRVSNAISNARQTMAEGVGSSDSYVAASALVAVYLKIEGKFGDDAGLKLTRKVEDEHWDTQFAFSNSLDVTAGAQVKARARVLFMEGAFNFEGKATSKLTLDVEGLPAAQQTGVNKGKKLKAKLHWDGVKLKYKGTARVEGFGASSTRTIADGEITVFDKEILGDWTI